MLYTANNLFFGTYFATTAGLIVVAAVCDVPFLPLLLLLLLLSFTFRSLLKIVVTVSWVWRVLFSSEMFTSSLYQHMFWVELSGQKSHLRSTEKVMKVSEHIASDGKKIIEYVESLPIRLTVTSLSQSHHNSAGLS